MTHLVGPNDVLLKQVDTIKRRNWLYSPPTPLLQAKGLTPSVLQQELNIINEKGNRIVSGGCFNLCGILLFTGLMISGFYLVASIYLFKSVTIPFYVQILIYFLMGGSMCLISICLIDRHNKAKSDWASLRQYIEIELNEQYQLSQGIRWTISEEKYVYQQTKSAAKVYYHILIQAVDIVQPQQHVVQMGVMDYNQAHYQVDGVQYPMQYTYV
eukprot:807825_1